MTQLGVPTEDVVLVRLESIGASVAQRPLASVVWSDLLSQAGANARPFARYLRSTQWPRCGVPRGRSADREARGALLVLGINVSMLLLAGCLTLLAQRAMGRTSWAERGGASPRESRSPDRGDADRRTAF